MKRVAGIHELGKLATMQKSIVVPSCNGFKSPRPAAYVINMQGFRILELIKQGMFIYKKEEPCHNNPQ